MYHLDLDPRLCALEDRLNDPAYQPPVNDDKALSADEILSFMTTFKTWKTIAKEMNISYNKLTYWAYKYKIQRPKKPDAKPNAIKMIRISNEQFMNAYSKDKSIREIARELKISDRRIKNIMHRLGLEDHPKRRGKKDLSISNDEFMRVYSPHKTWRQIARDLQVPLNRVYKAAKQFNIDKPSLKRSSKK